MTTYKVLDIEAVGEPWDGTLLCVGWDDTAYTLPLPGKVLAELADPSIAKVVFTKYDHRWLRLAGFVVNGPVVDVQAMAWLVNERTDLDLETVTRTYCPNEVKRSRIFSRAAAPWFTCDDGTEVPLEEAPLEELCAYNEQDLRSTEAVFHELRRLIYFEGQSEHYEKDVLPFTGTLLDMECSGVPVDVEAAERFGAELQEEAYDAALALHDKNGLPPDFNLNSGTQLAQLLYEHDFNYEVRVVVDKETRTRLKEAAKPTLNGMPVTKVGVKYASVAWPCKGLGLPIKEWTDSRKPATDAKTLQIHYGSNATVAEYLAMRKLVTMQRFTTAIAEQSHAGRLYGRFNQTGTKTGRLSSSGPNLQNLPAHGDLGKRIRSLFRPEPGMAFVHGDYSQLEPRLMAHFSGDPVLTDIYTSGADIYLETAKRIFGVRTDEEAMEYRSLCKVLVLALGYGSGAKTIRKQLALAGHYEDMETVEAMLGGLRSTYSVFWDWKDDVIARAEMDGYVETLSGQRRHFGTARGKYRSWREIATDERQAVNAVIQGSAADIVAATMMQTNSAALRLLVQVHDELLWEARPAYAREVLPDVQRMAEEGHDYALNVPLVFEPKVVTSWAEGK